MKTLFLTNEYPPSTWKREQLGHGYDFSSWVERTAIEMADAIVAVSQGTKEDVLRLFNVQEDRIHIIYSGIDPNEYRRLRPPTSCRNTA
jgi:alpha-maltose-1-phosphate synthase